MVKLRLARLMTVGLVLFLGASLVTAQEQGQGQRQRGQGGGGRGGFGGGFGGGRIGGVLSLITNEAVQKELAVDADTTAKLKKVSDEARAEATAGAGQFNREAFQGLSDEERRAKFVEMQKKGEEDRAKIVAKYQPQLKEILSETQYQRLQQIYWQSNLNAALSDPEVVKTLDITKEQQDKIAAVGKEYDEKQRGLFGGGRGGAGGAGGAGGGNFQEAMTKMQELNKEREAKVTDVLSAEQKEKFASLKGKPFDVAQLRGGFGGPGGGRGGRGAGGRPAGETEKKSDN